MATKGFNFNAAPDLAAQQMAMDRQRKIAEMLQQQAVTPDQGQTVQGGIYVAPHWTQGASKLAQALLSNKMNSNLDERQVALGTEQQKRLDAMIKKLAPPGVFDDQAPPALPGQLGSGMADAVEPPSGAPVIPSQPQVDPTTKQAWNRAAAAYMVSPELGGKLLENAATLTNEQKNNAAMGIDPQAMGRALLGKAVKESRMDVEPGRTVYDPLTFKPLLTAPDFKTGIQGGFDANGNPVMSGIAGNDVIPKMAGQTKAAEIAATNAGTIAPQDLIKNPDGTFTPRTIAQVVAGTTPQQPQAQEPRYQGQEIIEQLPPNVRAGLLEDARRSGKSQFDVNYQLPSGRVVSGKVELASTNGAPSGQPPVQNNGAVGQSTVDKQFQESLGTTMGKALTEGQSKAEELREGVRAIDKSLDLIQQGAILGAGADLKTDAAKILNDNFGTNISPDKVANTDFLRSTLGMPLLAKAKALGYNPTDADAKRLDVILGTISKNPAALPDLLKFNRELSIKAIEAHNKKAKDVKGPYSLTVEVPGAYVFSGAQPTSAAPVTPGQNAVTDYQKLYGIKSR